MYIYIYIYNMYHWCLVGMPYIYSMLEYRTAMLYATGVVIDSHVSEPAS